MYTKFRPIASSIVKKMNRQVKEKTEYLKRITNIKNILTHAKTMPVFFILFQERRSQNSGEKYAPSEQLTLPTFSADY